MTSVSGSALRADVESFVVAQLVPGARVLEVGCGDGDLARALDGGGFAVTAIDPDAPDGAIFERTTLEDFRGGGYDAVVAVRSLHHVHDLAAGIDKIASLLEPGGKLILDEFAWDAMDEATALWYLSHRDEGPTELETFLTEWSAEHEEHHASTAIRRAVEARFTAVVHAEVPYAGKRHFDDDALALEEGELIAAGAIRALGYRIVATKP